MERCLIAKPNSTIYNKYIKWKNAEQKNNAILKEFVKKNITDREDCIYKGIRLEGVLNAEERERFSDQIEQLGADKYKGVYTFKEDSEINRKFEKEKFLEVYKPNPLDEIKSKWSYLDNIMYSIFDNKGVVYIVIKDYNCDYIFPRDWTEISRSEFYKLNPYFCLDETHD